MRSHRRTSAGAFVSGLAILALLAAPAAGFGERVFNANTVTSGLTYPVSSVEGAAQSFTPLESFILYNVTLHVQNIGGGGNRDPLNVTIRTSAGGFPSGTILAGSDRIGGGNAGWLDFPFVSPPTLTAGTMYWIVAASTEPAGRGYMWTHSGGDIVPGFAVQNLGAGWTVTSNTDLAYVTYGIGLAPRIPAALVADRFSVPLGGTFAYTVYLNNTGFNAARSVRANLSLPTEVLYVSDTAASAGGARTGPSNWTFTSLANGPHVFAVTVRVGAGARAGATLTATVHVDYRDGAGIPQPPSTASASIIVGVSQKPMYLAFDGVQNRWDRLQAAAPTGALLDFDGDGLPGLTMTTGQNATFTLDPPIARPLHLWGTASLVLYLRSLNATDTVNFTLTLEDQGAFATQLASVSAMAVLSGGAAYLPFAFSLGALDHWVMRGNATVLTIGQASGGTAYLAYNAVAYPATVVVATETVVSVDAVSIRDARGPATLFSPRDTITIVANVSDPFGSAEIAGAYVSVTGPTGAVLATNATMSPSATDPRTPSAWRLFAHPLPSLSLQGRYTFSVSADEGNGVRASAVSGSFLVRAPVLGLAASANLTAVSPLGTVRYTLTMNNTGLGNATAWLNTTLPAGLAYASDTADALGGVRTGAASWTFATVDPGAHTFDLVLRVAGDAADGSRLALRFDLTYRDEKGFLTVVPPVTSELLVRVPAPAAGSFLGILVAIAVILAAVVIAFVLWRRRRGTIEEAFLVLQSGLLLCHLSRRMRVVQDKDHDVLGGMLTAIQNFVRDSFRYGENRSLEKLEFGDYRVFIEHGKWVYLAVAVQGHEPPGLRKEMRGMITEVEEKYDVDLQNFDGWMEPLLGVRDIMARMLKSP